MQHSACNSKIIGMRDGRHRLSAVVHLNFFLKISCTCDLVCSLYLVRPLHLVCPLHLDIKHSQTESREKTQTICSFSPILKYTVTKVSNSNRTLSQAAPGFTNEVCDFSIGESWELTSIFTFYIFPLLLLTLSVRHPNR